MLNIFKAHQERGWYKYSLHPSSYFIVDGKLKSINYFFTYHKDESWFSLKDVESHIYSTRQNVLKQIMKDMGYEWETPLPFEKIQRLALESFRNNYPKEFIDKAINLLNV
jgi:transcription initiation factor IIF auxiliary subunit